MSSRMYKEHRALRSQLYYYYGSGCCVFYMYFFITLLLIYFLNWSQLHFFTLTVSSVTCDFDHGVCGYSDQTGDKFNWTRYHGGTASVNTGPRADHTSGHGNLSRCLH